MDGYVCFDDGEGDCEWDYDSIGPAYASVNVTTPSPQIASLSTYSVTKGDTGTLTITGSNFIESSGDQLTLNFSGASNPFTLTSTPSVCTTTCTATFSYNFSGYPAGSYTLSVTNNEGTSNSESFTVVATAPPPSFSKDPCAVTSNPQLGFSSIVPTATAGGAGTMAVSFSGTAFATISPSVTYGPYSTPSSIASSIAALITKQYLQYGLSARAFGASVIYSGTTNLGTVRVTAGSSFTTDTSSAAATAAGIACYAAIHLPLPCLGLLPDYDTPRTYRQGNITETPREHITRKHIVGPATAVPLNTVYTSEGYTPPLTTAQIFRLVQAYNFTTVLLNPFPTPSGTGVVYIHTFQSQSNPSYSSGWIGHDAAGTDLYTNNLFLSADRCTVNTSYPSP